MTTYRTEFNAAQGVRYGIRPMCGTVRQGDPVDTLGGGEGRFIGLTPADVAVISYDRNNSYEADLAAFNARVMKAKPSPTPKTAYHGTYQEFDKPKLQNGVLWLAFDRKVAEGYGNPHWKPVGTPTTVWEIELRPSAKVVDLKDLSNPIVRKFKDEASMISSFMMGPISDEEYLRWADFGYLERYRWALGFFKSNGVQAITLDDNLFGTPHRSMAVISMRAIKLATPT